MLNFCDECEYYRIKNITFDKYFVIYDNELYEDMGYRKIPISIERLIKQKLMENIVDIDWEEIV